MPITTTFIDHFFDQCAKAFAFLQEKHGYTCIQGMYEQYNDREIIKPYNKRITSSQSIAHHAYEHGEISVIFRYAPQSHTITAYYRFRTEELPLQVMSKYFAPAIGGVHYSHEYNAGFDVRTTEDIDKVIQYLKVCLHPNMYLMQPWIITPRMKTIYEAIESEASIEKQALQAQYEATLTHIIEYANKAFLERDYKRVIELLQPYEKDLSPSDKKKLDLAKKQMLEP